MAKKINDATPHTEEQLIQKNENIPATPEASNNDGSGLEKQESTLELNDIQERISEVESREELADQRQADLDKREQNLDEREKSLDERELALQTTKPGKKTPGLEFKFEGQDFKFKDSAPKVINIDGRKLSQKQIIADEDILLQLVGGNSGLIIKI